MKEQLYICNAWDKKACNNKNCPHFGLHVESIACNVVEWCTVADKKVTCKPKEKKATVWFIERRTRIGWLVEGPHFNTRKDARNKIKELTIFKYRVKPYDRRD